MNDPVTVSAPANIAFIKYWGALDLDRGVPVNPSISMTLSACRSHTTCRYEEDARGRDEVRVLAPDGAPLTVGESFAAGIRRHLQRIRQRYELRGRFLVTTRNSFPAAAGLASSAAGFAALAAAASRSAGLDLAAVELSDLARLSGSGSAARSVLGGYVEWPAGRGEEKCHATQLAPAQHWDLCDLIAVVETGAKPVSSRDGHRRATSSPHFGTRQQLLPGRLESTRAALRARDLRALGEVLEEEAVELHLVAMSSRPPIFYWTPGTLEVLAAVRALRQRGTLAYATMDAGANVHVLCNPAEEPQVAHALRAVASVRQLIQDRVGDGPREEAEHLP